ncbi:hypothetical protein ACFO4U_14415 [Exiguobacterium profundum]|uniref:hypothetical protein n=1 Tax=Exiguobacterium TaxID=33986 RepID=UPI001BFC9692|nr:MULTISPECIES: hypothetical protein [Exiguobacterium]MCT4798870.1 hypothetical protein [Exiguobacterium profundum]
MAKIKFIVMIVTSLTLVCSLVFYPLFIDIWIENDSGAIYEFAKNIYQKKISLIYFILITAAVLAFSFWLYRNYREEIEKYEQESRETSRTLLRKYRELKEFDQLKTLYLTMEKFCLKYDLIFAVQIYSYHTVAEKNVMRCRIDYVDGFVKDRKDLNGMIQQNYYLNKRVYKEYKNAIQKFFENVDEVDALLRFIAKSVEEIENKEINQLKHRDAILYALLEDSIDTLNSYYPDSNNVFIKDNKRIKLENLLKDRRLGIYRGILLNGFYSFFYDGKGSKEGRQYITNPITISQKKYITLISLDPEMLSEEEGEKNQQLRMYVEEFENMLHDEFEIKYNDNEGDEYNAT